MALPDFGLMTKADKLKLDGIDTTTLLTKTEAASTYATKAEMREYIKQVVESDTGFVFINGNDSEVGLVPAMIQKENPNLMITQYGNTVGDTIDLYNAGGGYNMYFDVSYSGNGVITVSDTQGDFTFDSSNKQVRPAGKMEGSEGYTTTITVDLASDSTYDTATKVFTLNCVGNQSVTPSPEP